MNIGSNGDDVPDSAYDVGGDDFGGADEDSASAVEDDNAGAGGLAGLLEGMEESVMLSEKNTDAGDECSVGGGGEMGSGGEHDVMLLDDEGFDDFQGDVDNGGGPAEPEIYVPPDNGGVASSAIPRVELLHTLAPSFASSKTVEGSLVTSRMSHLLVCIPT